MLSTSVKDLRKAGYKIRVGHLRYFYYPQLKNPQLGKHASTITASPPIPYPRGGTTIVRVTTPSGVIGEAEAVCAHTDQYNKKRGVQIAMGRAFKKILEQQPK